MSAVSANMHLGVWKIYIRRLFFVWKYSNILKHFSEIYQVSKVRLVSENSILERSISTCYYCSLKRSKNISLDRNNVFIVEYNEICDG